jgi:hypothetical protein
LNAHNLKSLSIIAVLTVLIHSVMCEAGFCVDGPLELSSLGWTEPEQSNVFGSAIIALAPEPDGNRIAIGVRPLLHLGDNTTYDLSGKLWGSVIILGRSGRGHFSLVRRLQCSADFSDDKCGGNPRELFFLGNEEFVALLNRSGGQPRWVAEHRKADTGELIRRLLPPADFDTGVDFSPDAHLTA